MKKEKRGTLTFLYETAFGRLILKLLTARWVSAAAGAFCDSRLSKPLIKKFINNNNIDLTEYVKDRFSSFNDCFTREIRGEVRPVCMDESALISPCDGLLSAYRVDEDTVFPAKQSAYRLSDFLGDEALAREFHGGVLLVFRLCVHHYHRYCYFDSGKKGDNVFIKGKLHTVRPIALRNRPVFCENCREYTVMETENFGKAVQCEVGALLVGKIKNHDGKGGFERGKEKGMFLYGGSTVVLLLRPGAAEIPGRFFEAAERGEEIPVKYGEQIGRAVK